VESVRDSWNDQGRVWVLDARTGQKVSLLQEPLLTINAMTVSVPRGEVITVAKENVPTIKVWNLETGALLRTLTDPVPPQIAFGTRGFSAAVSGDGNTLAVGTADGWVILWDLATGQLITRLGGLKGVIQWVRLSPDGKRIVASIVASTGTLNKGKAMLWGLDRPSQHPLEVLKGFGSSFALSPDGKYFVMGSDKGEVVMWNIEEKSQQDDH
jgi:WD40 repeat protein